MFYVVKIEGIEAEEILIFTGYTDEGSVVSDDHIKRMFELDAVCHAENIVSPGSRKARLIYDETVQKLDRLYEEAKI